MAHIPYKTHSVQHLILSINFLANGICDFNIRSKTSCHQTISMIVFTLLGTNNTLLPDKWRHGAGHFRKLLMVCLHNSTIFHSGYRKIISDHRTKVLHVRLLPITSDYYFPPMQVLPLARFFIRVSIRPSDQSGNGMPA